MKTIATINFKGGVGKTTVTWCLGDVLSSSGESNVLLFDLDAQGSLTQSIELGADLGGLENFSEWRANSKSIYDALKQYGDKGNLDFDPTDNFIYKLSDNYGFVPSVEDLYWLEMEKDVSQKEFFIKKLLGRVENSGVMPKYDYALFDCPPSFTTLSYSALTCCDLILIPVNPDFFAAKGVDILLRVLKEKIQPHPLPKIAVFSNRVRESLQGYWNDKYMAPTYEEQRWISDIKDVCEQANAKHKINVHYLDAYIRGRVAVMRAIANRRTPAEHIGEFINLWKESGGKLK